MVQDIHTGEKVLVDELNGEHTMESSETEKYLGDLVSNNGRNEKNIKARKAKGTGIVDQIISIMDGTVYGPFHFEVALILRSSLLLNGILTNSEAWYGLKISDLEQLEQIDEKLLRKILEVGSGCPKEMLYLETGSIPIRFIVTFRRIMFLHYILNQDPESLIGRFFRSQVKSPCRNDWCISVESDMKELGIKLTFNEIKSLSKQKFKTFVKKIIEEKSISYLNVLKLKHTKVMHIEHTGLCLQEYLQPKNVQNIQLSKFLFQARTRMLDCRANFGQKYKNDDMNCPLKCETKDTQKHLLECDKIDTNCISSLKIARYEDLFSNDVKKQMKIALMLQDRFNKRKKMMA